MKGFTTKEKDEIKSDITIEKKCSKCNIHKQYKKFSSKKESNGLWYFGICNQCTYKRKLERCSKKQLQEYQNTQRFRESFTLDGRASMLYNRCKQRSKKYNHEFSLTKEFIINLLKDGKCQKTNIKLIIDDSSYNPYAPSIDRIDNEKGYTNDNIQVTCMIYNFCKNKFTEKQVNKFFKDIQL